jgi:galactose-1-phosphate uridylyltransferase
MIDASRDYRQSHNRTYWEDYLAAEIKNQQRLIHQGQQSIWLTDFVSLSPLTDVIGIFPGKQTLFDLDRAAVEESAALINAVLDWLGQQGVYSLNLAWLPAAAGMQDHWLQVRISPRLYLAPNVWCTDTPSLVSQYQESFMIRAPEEVAGEIKSFVQHPSP